MLLYSQALFISGLLVQGYHLGISGSLKCVYVYVASCIVDEYERKDRADKSVYDVRVDINQVRDRVM